MSLFNNKSVVFPKLAKTFSIASSGKADRYWTNVIRESIDNIEFGSAGPDVVGGM